jgi:hypothetical protein
LQVRLVAEVVVEPIPDVPFVGTTLAVIGVAPTEHGGTIRTVEMLFGSRVEYAALLVGNGEFHDGSAAHFYTSDGSVESAESSRIGR